ncbi:MAG: amidohydrolase [Clostridium sp.]
MGKDNSLLIKNGNIYTITGSILNGHDVLIEKGKIVDIRENILGDYPTIDASGLSVLPGFIEAHCHIGIEEPSGVNPGNLNETSSPITPYIKGIDGVNFNDTSFQRALENGVTTVATGPGSGNVIGGVSCILRTYGDSPYDMIISEKSSMKAALGENPKRIHGSKGRCPITKMGIAHLLRETLRKAQIYYNKREVNLRGKEYNEIDISMEELLPVINGSMPLSIHVHRSDDIFTALRIKEEFGIRVTLLHVTEGRFLLDHIKDLGCSAVLGPIMSFSKKMETNNKSNSTPKDFVEKGILTSITTDHPVTPIEYLGISAGLCVREGLSYVEALKAITINPAKILGIDKRVGSIEIGKDADIQIIEGVPLEVMSKVVYVVGKGKVVYKAIN